MRTLLGGFVLSLAQPQLEIMRVITKVTTAYRTGEGLRGQRGTLDITGHLLFRGWQCFARSAGWLGLHTDSETRDYSTTKLVGGSCAPDIRPFPRFLPHA